jgi:hypothetical protein
LELRQKSHGCPLSGGRLIALLYYSATNFDEPT